MTIELEKKFLLPIEKSNLLFDTLSYSEVLIEQSYCNGYRLRCQSTPSSTNFFFNKKIKSNIHKGSNIEMEIEISKEDYEDLYMNRIFNLSKKRKSFQFQEQHIDIDYFYQNSNPYLLTMEIEYNPGTEAVIPDLFKDHVLKEFTMSNFDIAKKIGRAHV